METNLATNHQDSDWQKIDAINIFILPLAGYLLNVALIDKTWASSTDATIRKIVKLALYLPKRTVSAIFHVAQSQGGLGIGSLEDKPPSISEPHFPLWDGHINLIPPSKQWLKRPYDYQGEPSLIFSILITTGNLLPKTMTMMG